MSNWLEPSTSKFLTEHIDSFISRIKQSAGQVFPFLRSNKSPICKNKNKKNQIEFNCLL